MKGGSKKQESKPITDFNGYYEFLNNDFASWICLQGVMFPSAATAFQAARTCDKQVRLAISEVEDYDELVRIVRSIKNPPDWAKNRYKVMEKIVRDKFKRNRPIADKLVATKDRELVNSFLEGADSELYWGVVNGTGQNNLGKILMGVRDDIIRLNDSEKWLLDQNCETDPSLFPEVDLVVQKEDKNIDKLFLEKRNCFLFGSEAKNSFRLEHPSISKFHAGIYFSTDLEVVLVDLNSTHGTKVVRDGKSIALEALKPFALAKADVLIFGMSSRRYLVNINTEKVQAYIISKEKELQREIQKAEELKALTFSEEQQILNRNQIKSLIGLKRAKGIFLQKVNLAYNYNDLKKIFNQFGKVQNLRMFVNKYTGKFEGNVLVSFVEQQNVEESMKDFLKEQQIMAYPFEARMVDEVEAEAIIKRLTDVPDVYAVKGKKQKRKHDKGERSGKIKNHHSSSSSRSRSRSREKKHPK